MPELPQNIIQWVLGLVLILSSIGVILAKKPVYSSLFFLLTLMTLAVTYLQLSASFISVMQIIVYAGAILVIFMFVIVLFQDAYLHIEDYQSKSYSPFLYFSAAAFVFTLILIARHFVNLQPIQRTLPDDYGTVQSLGKVLYLDFFFPFEAVILLFLVALVGALYVGRKIRPKNLENLSPEDKAMRQAQLNEQKDKR